MRRRPRGSGLSGVRRALDEARFGPHRTLNLRAAQPSAESATQRAEAWLRQQQVEQASDVLIITGRGNQSPGGVSVVRQAVVRLLHSLKRRGVIAGHQEHTPGSFVVTLAPVSALWESPRRHRERTPPSALAAPPSLEGIDADSRRMLRQLAERAFVNLGVKDGGAFVEGEMLRLFSAIAATLGSQPDRERRLRAALQAALDEEE